MADAGIVFAKLPPGIPLTRVEHPLPGRIINHVVKIFDLLLADKFAKDVDIAVRERVAGENVVVGDNDNFFPIPNFCGGSKLSFEYANRARSAHIVGHQDVDIHPNIIAGSDGFFARSACHYFFGKSHAQTIRKQSIPRNLEFRAVACYHNDCYGKARRFL